MLTGYILMKQTVQTNIVNDSVESLDSSIAQAWGKKVTEMYNQQDHQGLYALFNEKAKVKISHHQLESQLKKLFHLFGEIEQSAFISAENIGEKGGELYYKLLFNIRVKDPSKRLATLTISIVSKSEKVSLYGIRINANYPLD